MSQPTISSSRVLVLLILSFTFIPVILETGSTYYAMGQRSTEPGVTPTTPPDTATATATEPGVTPTTSPDSATGSTLATTTTSTSTYSSTKGGLHISTTITNTTTVIPVQR